MEIDLVYLWVDGSDPVWRAKKRAYMSGDAPLRDDADGECRFFDNDELKYSLRSVERYAPWIRRIFIVTDGQCPVWLDTSNPRIRVVDHREIVPAERLPLFNSNALEYYLSEIPDLSEHFLYANDDMLFGAPADPRFFFDAKGRPIVRLKVQSLKRHLGELYAYKVYRAQQMICSRYGKRYTLAPHHNIDAYRKSDFKACKEAFAEQVEESVNCRFRTNTCLQRSVILYYALAHDLGVMRKVTRYNRIRGPWQWLRAVFGGGCASDSRCIPVNAPDPAGVLAKYAPVLFCMNDGEKVTPDDRVRSRRFLEQLFPAKSQFERS